MTDWKRVLAVFDDAAGLDAEGRAKLLERLAGETGDIAARVRTLFDAEAGNSGTDFGRHVEAELLAVADPVDDGTGFTAGDHIGPYRLLEAIGRGGMASVWLAERDDDGLCRRFALKLPHALHARHGLAERFARERDILARLRHPHIARLHDAGVADDGQPFLAIDHIEGAPITVWCDTHGSPLRVRLELFLQVLEAVQYAHANLVIHRDLKPGNILVDTQGQVSLLDFGIARLLDDTGAPAGDGTLTATGGRLLTVPYASPEQIRGEALTTATDLYSLGAVLHELIAGMRPYRLAFASAAQLEQAIATATREPLTRGATDTRARMLGLRNAKTLRRAVSGDLEAIVTCAMAAAPGERYASAAAFGDDLRRHLGGHPVLARRPSRLHHTLRFVRRHAIASAIVGVLAVAVLASSVLVLATAQRERVQRERAEAAREFLVGVFAQASPDENKGQPFTAEQLLEKGERQLATEQNMPAALQIELTSLIGELYWNIGDYARAETLLRKAIESVDAEAVPDDVHALILLRLARAELSRNANEAAVGHAEQAILRAGRVGTNAQIEASQARRIVAEAVIAQGSAERALPILDDALAADRTAFGEASAEVAADWELFGLAYKELSRHDEAIAAADRAIAGLTAVHGRDHSSVISALGVRASALAHKGDSDGAIATLGESAAIATRLYGPEHRDTIVQRSNLYLALNRAGHTQAALDGHLALLDIARRTLADTRPEQLAYIHGALAAEYRGLSRFAESAASAHEAVALWTRIKASESAVELADPLWSLGVAELMLGHADPAQAALQRAIAIAARHQAADSQWRAMYRGYLSILLRHEGHPREALAEIESAIAAIGAAAGQPTPIPVFLRATLAEARLDAGDSAGALTDAQKAMAMANDAVAPNALMLRAPQFALARALGAHARAAEAEPLLRAAIAANRPPFGDSDPRILEIEVELASTLASLGRTAEAVRLRDDLAPRLHALDTRYARSLLARLPSG
ncbi:serine/threonine-protein kinase [Dokdonella sp.]|uniref:serine/threonine-protein kinase n=1 Tax=Dokdonella sp. TaxID=2291710 RepID=UPI0025C09B8A|nr:serine/threonine-protein kinase [Dokdonella sp.]MBX3693036.1 serine/threonine protein kinase [Dokdonella sp.]MCW5568893.1 serine/threonine protein kinase [Dokdonella sp.]